MGEGSIEATPPSEVPAGQLSSGGIPSGLTGRLIDTSVAHPARVYDYWLGGKDHFAPDREAGEQVKAVNPGIVSGVLRNRAFLRRVVRYLAVQAGIRQFLDLGTGLPSADNVHEVAQAAAAGTRVVYVDHDPIVLAHAQALLTGANGTIAYLQADLRDTAAILTDAARTLDLDQPVALLLLMTLQFIPDEDDPWGIVRTLLDAVPAGSYLAVSHPIRDDEVGIANTATARYNERVATPMTRRTPDQVAAFAAGLELVEPGLVALADWRPDLAQDPVTGTPSPALCLVARKP